MLVWYFSYIFGSYSMPEIGHGEVFLTLYICFLMETKILPKIFESIFAKSTGKTKKSYDYYDDFSLHTLHLNSRWDPMHDYYYSRDEKKTNAGEFTYMCVSHISDDTACVLEIIQWNSELFCFSLVFLETQDSEHFYDTDFCHDTNW